MGDRAQRGHFELFNKCLKLEIPWTNDYNPNLGLNMH